MNKEQTSVFGETIAYDGICCHCGEFLFSDKDAILYIDKEEYCPWNTAGCEYDEGCQCFKCEAIKEKATD